MHLIFKLTTLQQGFQTLKSTIEMPRQVRIVKDVVQRIMKRTKAPNPYCVGEVCQILAFDNPDLRGKGGCWGIVARVNDFSGTAKA
ncbi:MAG: hypothetical protein RMY28_006670 [Nostoc sp. ChiSLP01]